MRLDRRSVWLEIVFWVVFIVDRGLVCSNHKFLLYCGGSFFNELKKCVAWRAVVAWIPAHDQWDRIDRWRDRDESHLSAAQILNALGDDTDPLFGSH